MNGKTARKLLRRGQGRNMWGDRAFFTVRIPLSAMPSRPPAFEASELGTEPLFEGVFEKVVDDKVYHTHIGSISGQDPPKGALLVTPNEFDPRYFTWWEGTVLVFDAKAYDDWWVRGTAPRPEPIEKKPISENLLRAYVERRSWLDRYTYKFDFPEGSPLTRLAEAAWFSKTQYGEIRGEYFYLTFSIKYFYRHRAIGFCRAITRVMRACKRAGIKLRVVR